MLWVSRADHRTVALMDGVAAFWLVFWLVVAGLTGYEVWSLTRLSDSAVISAQAADSAGKALQSLSEIPLVGEQPGQLGSEVRTAAADVQESAARTREDVRQLAVLLGLSIFLIPSSPVLGWYLPARVRRRGEIKSLRRHLDGGRPNPSLEAYLAHQALLNLTYAEVMAVTDDPAGDVRQGRYASLAAAELERLGLPDSTRR
jgi:hypothetical protein